MHESPLPSIRADATGVPLPPNYISARARRSLIWAGLYDRTHYRKVREPEHTHFTLRLFAQYLAGLAAVDQWRTSRHLELQQNAARAQGVLAAEVPDATAGQDAKQLVGLDARQCLVWANTNRSIQQNNGRRASLLAAQASARAELPTIREELEHLDAQAENARKRWQADLSERFTIYGRFRSRRVAPAELLDALVQGI